MTEKNENILVSLVTWNSSPFLETCLESVRSQSVPVSISVFDNGSMDSSVEIARKFDINPLVSKRNLGFSRGHNENLRNRTFQFGLILNPDVRLETSFIETLVQCAGTRSKTGMAGGKLYRSNPQGEIERKDGQDILDSTGMYFTPNLRHFDRGSETIDKGQFDTPQSVFGITGAAVLIRRDFYKDVSIAGEFFDEDFFAYREDADLAWRAQLMGWDCVYVPGAVGRHVRKVLPQHRRQVNASINYHSVKNRFLMRIKNIDWGVRLRCFPSMWIRDLGIAAYVPVFERSSLKAFSSVRKLRRKMLEKRREIQCRRRISPREMASWFSYKPKAFDL